MSRLRNADPCLVLPPTDCRKRKPCPLATLNRLSLCAAAIGALAIAAVAISPSRRASEEAVIIPAARCRRSGGRRCPQTAVIAGGCFWGVQGVYQHTAGVLNAVSGYSGGSKMTANYSMIGTGTTLQDTRRGGRDQVRSEEDQLWQDPADFLLRRA